MNAAEAYYLTKPCGEFGDRYESVTGRKLSRCKCGTLAHPDSQGEPMCAMCNLAQALMFDTRGVDEETAMDWSREVRMWEGAIAYENAVRHVEEEAWGVYAWRRNYWLAGGKVAA